MENNEDTQLSLKQDSIKTEIIDKNYDKDKFLNFCLSKKKGGDDLTKWTLLELNEAISDFKNECDKENSQQDKASLDKEEKKENDETQNINSIEKIEISEVSKDEIFQKEITCKKLEKTVLNDKEIITIIRNPKISDASILQSSYVTYEIFTESQKWLVRRRFSDFEWLRNILCKNYPRLFVPPIPGKKLGNRRFQNDFIEKRMKYLQKFINEVLKNEDLKTCEGLIDFLSMTDRGQFESKMKELTSFQPSPYVEESKTLTGKITVIDDKDNEKYYSNILNYFRLQKDLYNKLNYNLKSFYVNIKHACINLEEVQKDFETLTLLNTKVLMKEEITKTFEELGIFFKNWKRILYNQNEIIKKNIKEFFKYKRMEGNAYNELIEKREVIKSKYKYDSERLTSKKEKLWQALDVSKWQIEDDYNQVDKLLLIKDKNYAFSQMCTRETKDVENLHKQLGYANKCNIDELIKFINSNAVKFVDNMKEFSEEFYPTLTDGISVWSTLNGYV